jgi:hypothetical protein
MTSVPTEPAGGFDIELRCVAVWATGVALFA